MASKKFKRKTCAYCGVPDASETGDHIFARQFFLERDRAYLPQVAACARCNTEKSRLEGYLLQILPLGANHESAKKLIQTQIPKRAMRPENKVLRELIENPRENVFLIDQAGQLYEREPALIEANILDDWCRLVARGLAYFHWNVVTPNYDIVVEPIMDERERELLAIARNTIGADRVDEAVGSGTFKYRGFRCADHRTASIWIIKLYGAMPIGGDPTVSVACATGWAVYIRPSGDFRHRP